MGSVIGCGAVINRNHGELGVKISGAEIILGLEVNMGWSLMRVELVMGGRG